MRHASPMEINKRPALRSARRNPYALDAEHDPPRIRGGNWKMQGFRHSGQVYDEAECQMSIAEFMAQHEPDDIE